MKHYLIASILVFGLTVLNAHAQDCTASFFYENVLNSVTFYNNTTYNYTDAVWDFGDGSPIVSNPSIAVPHVYAISGTYNVCLIISGLDCTDTLCQSVQVCGYLSNYSYIVSGLAVAFTNLSIGNYTQTIWDFGDGTTSLQANPIKGYDASGLYDVCLVLGNEDFSCTQIHCESVAVSNSADCENPTQINPNNNCNNEWAPVCGCNNVTYANSCKAFYDGGITSWTNGACSGACIAAFDVNVNLLNVNFNNYSVGEYTSTSWDFGDGNTSEESNPSHSYAGPGTYNVCLSISGNGCNDTHCLLVEVTGLPECHAHFTSTQTCTHFLFAQTSTGSFTNAIWDLGDGTSASGNDVTKEYLIPGTYSVCLTITGSGCQDTYCQTIIIPDKNNVKAGLIAQYTPSVLPLMVQFTGIDSFNTAFSYLWDFGDGNFSSEKNIQHYYTDNCAPTVCFTIKDQNNCSSSACKNLSLCTDGINKIQKAIYYACYPNPANSELNIVNHDALHQQVHIEILSITGVQIKEQTLTHWQKESNISIPVSDLSSGLYIIQINDSKKRVQLMFMKQ